jgi:hypothetical protein
VLTVRVVKPRRAIDVERRATQRGVRLCHEVTEQARRKVVGKDEGEWVARSLPGRAEVASVRVADTRLAMLRGSLVIKRLARSVERQ